MKPPGAEELSVRARTPKATDSTDFKGQLLRIFDSRGAFAIAMNRASVRPGKALCISIRAARPILCALILVTCMASSPTESATRLASTLYLPLLLELPVFWSYSKPLARTASQNVAGTSASENEGFRSTFQLPSAAYLPRRANTSNAPVSKVLHLP